MGRNIYVGNLAYSATEESISSVFGQYGNVDSCRLVIDRDTGRSKGFAFIEMSSDAEAADAISALDGTEINGRALKVNEARPKEDRSSGRSNSRSWGTRH